MAKSINTPSTTHIYGPNYSRHPPSPRRQEAGTAAGIVVCSGVRGPCSKNHKITETLANPGDSGSIIMINLQLYIEIMRLGAEDGGGKSRGFQPIKVLGGGKMASHWECPGDHQRFSVKPGGLGAARAGGAPRAGVDVMNCRDPLPTRSSWTPRIRRGLQFL